MWQSSKIKGKTVLNQEIATLRLSASLAMTVVSFRQPESSALTISSNICFRLHETIQADYYLLFT
ncbi:MAG: hypothetical protein IJR44_00925 [Neisseriaceae bacterium]|nr:hypothetical protein [Neisseriaceae bacterium]